MTLSAKLSMASATLLLACGPGDRASRSDASLPPGAQTADARVADKQVVKTFLAAGVSRVVFRAALARDARVTSVEGKDIVVTGTPRGGAGGYHSPDPKWRETSASQWGLDFREKAFGKTLVISTVNEIRYIHHGYYMDQLAISVPTGVEVALEARQLSGDGAPDLGESSADSLPPKR